MTRRSVSGVRRSRGLVVALAARVLRQPVGQLRAGRPGAGRHRPGLRGHGGRARAWPAARWPTTRSAASTTRWLSTGLAGVIGVLLCFALGAAVSCSRSAGRRRRSAAARVRRSRRGPDHGRRARASATCFFVHAESGVHRLAPECKLVATVLFVFAVVATPREAFWAFALRRGRSSSSSRSSPGCRWAGWPAGWSIEVPFLAFAVFLPFVGTGPYVEVGFLTLSEPGLWGAWNIVVKGTLGVAASSLLTATTTVPELLRALERLRVPRAGGRHRQLHGPVRRGAVRRPAPDADRPARPAVTTRGGSGRCGHRPDRRGVVRPVLRARRAGLRGDAGPRLRVRAGAADGRRAARRATVRGCGRIGRARPRRGLVCAAPRWPADEPRR